MGKATDQTRREIEQTRRRITAEVDQLESTVRATLDWQAYVRSRPWLFVGIAIGTGFLLAGGPKRGISHGFQAVTRKGKGRLALPDPTNFDQSSFVGRFRGRRAKIKQRREPSGTLWERIALRATDAGATVVAATLLDRLLREIEGKEPATS